MLPGSLFSRLALLALAVALPYAAGQSSCEHAMHDLGTAMHVLDDEEQSFSFDPDRGTQLFSSAQRTSDAELHEAIAMSLRPLDDDEDVPTHQAGPFEMPSNDHDPARLAATARSSPTTPRCPAVTPPFADVIAQWSPPALSRPASAPRLRSTTPASPQTPTILPTRSGTTVRRVTADHRGSENNLIQGVPAQEPPSYEASTGGLPTRQNTVRPQDSTSHLLSRASSILLRDRRPPFAAAHFSEAGTPAALSRTGTDDPLVRPERESLTTTVSRRSTEKFRQWSIAVLLLAGLVATGSVTYTTYLVSFIISFASTCEDLDGKEICDQKHALAKEALFTRLGLVLAIFIFSSASAMAALAALRGYITLGPRYAHAAQTPHTAPRPRRALYRLRTPHHAPIRLNSLTPRTDV